MLESRYLPSPLLALNTILTVVWSLVGIETMKYVNQKIPVIFSVYALDVAERYNADSGCFILCSIIH